MGRRDSPFRLQPRLALVPWLARFGAAALPSPLTRRDAAPARNWPSAASRCTHALGGRAAHVVRPSRDPQRLRARRRAGHAERRGGRASSSRRSRLRSPARSFTRTRRTATRARSSPRCSPARPSHGAEIRTGVEILRLRARNGSISGLDTTTGRCARARSCSPPGRGPASSRTRSACTSRSRPRRATTSRSTASRCAPGIPVYMEESRVIATPLGGRLRLAGTLELAGLDLRVDHVRLATLVRAARRTLVLPRRDAHRQGVARAPAVRARRAADHRALSRASRTSFWPPRMRCSASHWHP